MATIADRIINVNQDRGREGTAIYSASVLSHGRFRADSNRGERGRMQVPELEYRYPNAGDDVDGCINKADSVMGKTRRTGKNSCTFASPDESYNGNGREWYGILTA